MSILSLAPLARLLMGRAETAAGRVGRPRARLGRSLAAHLILPLMIGAGSLVLALALGAGLLVQERAQQDLVARRLDRATELTRRSVLDTERSLIASARQLASLPGISQAVAAEEASRLQVELLAAQNRDHLGFILVLNSRGEVATGVMAPGTLDLLKPLLLRAQTRDEPSALVWGDEGLWMLAAASERADGSQGGLVIVGRPIEERSLLASRDAGAPVALLFGGRTVGSTHFADSVEGRDAIVTSGGDALEVIAHVPLGPYRDAVTVGHVGIAATAIGCIVLFMVYSAIVVRRAARPLRSLAQAVNAVAAGDRTVAAPVDGPCEVATVGGAFNDMVAAIGAREDDLRRLVRENEARYRELEVLNELSLSILGSPDLETIGGHVLDTCLAIGSFDLGNIYLRNPDEDLLIPLVNRGFWHPEIVTPRRRNVDDQGGGRPRRRYVAVASHRPLVIEDLQAEDGYRTLRAEGVRSGIFVPLLAENEALGVLQLGTRSLRRFEPGEVALMEAVGHQLGIAIQKARLHDATQKAYAEQQAGEEARERLVAILEATTDMVGVVQVDGGRMYLNRAGRRLLGLGDDEDLSSIGVTRGRPSWAKERLMAEAIPAAIRDGNWTGETAFLDRENNEIPFSQVIIAHKDADGKVAFLSTIARDISAHKEAERQKEAFAQTEKLRALGQMAGGIAHDLNQCLALVAGHAELAARSLEKSADGEAACASLQTVLRAARDGAQSVKRLQTYARPTQSDPPERLDLGPLVGEVANLTAPAWRDAAQQQGRRIEMRVETDGDTAIEGSASDLREAFTNLVFNAVDALPTGGTIDLLVRRRGDRVEADVRDSGVGMPLDVRAKVFEPFFTTKGEHGLGLGLSMVFGVVERHAGKVEVDSALGRGTTFRLSFPAASGAAGYAESPEGLAPARSLRILAVDDEPDIANMVSLMLQPFGHQMAVATSGEEALERLAKEPFDLVISDVGMGARMNGWELADQVKKNFPGVHLVLATGWGAEIDHEDARSRGVDAVVSKPFRIADLERVVAAI